MLIAKKILKISFLALKNKANVGYQEEEALNDYDPIGKKSFLSLGFSGGITETFGQ